MLSSFSKLPTFSVYSTVSMATTARPLLAGTTVIKKVLLEVFFTAASCYREMLSGLVSGLLFFKIRTAREPVISAGFFNRNRSKRVCLSNYKPYFNVLAESVSNTTPYAYFWSLINTRLFVCSFRLRRRKSWNGGNGSLWYPRSRTRYALLYGEL